MAPWLDIAIVGSAIAAAGLYTWRIYRRANAAACAKGCGGACATPPAQNDLVQLGRKDRALLADSPRNR